MENIKNDTLVRIGSVLYNQLTHEVVTVVTQDTLYGEFDLKSEVVSRWLSPDPLASKYSNWSPYNYAINNPVLFVDPDGMEIIISIKGRGEEADKQRAEILSNLRSLTNDKLDIDRDGKVSIASRSDNDSKSTGTDLVRNLIEGVKMDDGTTKNYTVTITKGENNGTDPVNSKGLITDESKANAQNNTGTGSLINFNPNKKGDNVINADGTTGRPAQIGLAHELIHAENNMAGRNDKTDTKKIAPEGRNSNQTLTKEEDSTRRKENVIRTEQKYKQRLVN
jgi:uncharacterized protein RhaS with RHS repeats